MNAQDPKLAEVTIHLASYLYIKKGSDGGALNINAKDDDTGSALKEASCRGLEEAVRLLLENGADVNAKGGYYGTVWQVALRFGDQDMAKLLLENGADMYAEGRRHGTALQAASYFGHENIVRLLLETGAIADNETMGAALNSGSEAVINLIRNAFAFAIYSGFRFGPTSSSG